MTGHELRASFLFQVMLNQCRMKEIHADNLALAPLVAQKSAMGQRCGPAHLPAKVALVMLLLTLAAEWFPLVLTPNLGGASLLSETEVAEAAGDQATELMGVRRVEYVVKSFGHQSFGASAKTTIKI